MSSLAVQRMILHPSRTLVFGLGLLAFATVVARGPALLVDPDVYMHIAVGRWILDHGAIPHTDVFSHSMRGVLWVPHEWLTEVILAWLYNHFGWTSQVLITAACLALAVAILLRALLSYVAPIYAIIGAILAWGMCFPHLLARPHVFVYPLLVLWTTELVAARQENRPPSLVLVPVILVWANMHASFVFGLALAALFGAEALLEAADWRSARRVISGWGLFGLLAIAVTFVNPSGIDALLLPIKTLNMKFALSSIAEWQSPDFQRFQPLEFWLLLFILGALVLGAKLPVTRTSILLLLIHLALQHQRNAEYLGLVTPLLIAPAIRRQVPRSLDAIGLRALPGWMYQLCPRMAFPLSAFALAIFATSGRLGMEHPVDRMTPSAALAVAHAHHITGPVLNDFNFGGFLIFSGVPTMIDGRTDVYPDAFIRRYAQLDELPALLREYNIEWTLLWSGTPGAVLMDHLTGWQRLYVDDVAVVHVHTHSESLQF
jgi:hypothetical protein